MRDVGLKVNGSNNNVYPKRPKAVVAMVQNGLHDRVCQSPPSMMTTTPEWHGGRKKSNKNNNQNKASSFHRAKSFGNFNHATRIYSDADSPRVRSHSGEEMKKKSTSPILSTTPDKSSGLYFASAKFNATPEPSQLPPPPLHWKSVQTTSPQSCNREYQMNNNLADGIDFTAHLKTLLRVEL